MTTINWIRYIVAYVFITSGLMKFISPELGQVFISLPLPSPMNTMYVIAIIEIVCGISILLNKWTRGATIPLMVIMLAALFLTKVPILHSGFLQFAFNARLDITMLVLLFFIFSQSPRR
ncbi:putative membrane protein YphA (DoxX/SURF4 family) [Oikeobacillus pervagus]|uniref:Membrane protein YphA (DoxX/SURF4 family) n=1 Tax=Oikeobacillus pervagus TaxID=1325931 RepID=A0AAJ1WLA8_9BACI|nr:DoxX family protein [Oikeobacillus pervagus]MDQ0216001.1 putative membrane protein YphA (DoxX/SURF4 family) [Oikeobacillus pervagus]